VVIRVPPELVDDVATVIELIVGGS